MKRLIIPALILLFLISCQKEETPISEVPDWFLPQIEKLEKSGECYGCTITKISYNNKIYYYLYCGYWSCIYCNLFDENGKLVEWETYDFSDFIENKIVGEIIWKCGD